MIRVGVDESFFNGAVSFEKGPSFIKPWRLPHDRLALFPPADLIEKAEMPAGVRLRFTTDSPTVALEVAPAPAERAFDLTSQGEPLATALLRPRQKVVRFEGLGAGRKTLEIWLPHVFPTAVRRLLVEDGTRAEPAPDEGPRWTAYGSSITHCADAHSPSRTWPALVARKCGLNLTCLGFGGNCVLEPMVARVIRDLPADFISLKLGINTHDGSLSPRTFKPAAIGMVRIIREKHPDIPVALISPIISPDREAVPSAAGLSVSMMRDELSDAVERLRSCGDENLHYFDGRKLFGADLVEKYLPDLLHPNGDGYEKLAENFLRVVMKHIEL